MLIPANPAAQESTLLPADLSVMLPSGEPIRHILLGSPSAIRQTIHLLHNLRYVETSQWSPLIDVPHGQLILQPDPGHVISLLTRHL